MKEKFKFKAPKLTVGQPFPFTRNSTTVKENHLYQSKLASDETEIRSCDKGLFKYLMIIFQPLETPPPPPV